MKILLIADLHTCTQTAKLKSILQNETYDIICLLGDNSSYDLDNITNYSKKVPIIGILGNHDNKNLYNEYPNIYNLHNSLKKIDDFSFIGFEGCYKYKESSISPMYIPEEVEDIMSNYSGADIFVSHTGPFLPERRWYELSHNGFTEFNKYISSKKPKYHFFGHFHENFKIQLYDTQCFCIYGVSSFDTEKEILIPLILEP